MSRRSGATWVLKWVSAEGCSVLLSCDGAVAAVDADGEGEGGIGTIRAGAFDELRKLSNNGAEDGAEGIATSGKKKKTTIFDMKFMKEAAARQSRAVDKDIDDFKRELGRLGGGGSEDGSEVGDVPEEDATQPSIERVGGRMVFRPGPQVSFHFFPS